eukprot:SAG11_NODE_22596_length_403_cov_0.842105_1_plen_28_part_10
MVIAALRQLRVALRENTCWERMFHHHAY